MIIAFLTPSMNSGGAERVIATLANVFCGKDKIYILELGDGESGYPLDEQVSLIKLDVAKVSKNSFDTFNNVQRQRKIIAKTIYEINADVIFAFTMRLAVVAKFAVGKRCVVIGSERGNPFIAHNSYLDKVVRIFSPMIDGCVFQTRGASRYYPQSIQRKSEIIPNGVFLNIPKLLPEYVMRKNTIVVTGNLRKLKRHDLILEAFGQLHGRYPDYELHIYGEGETQAALIRYIKEKKLDDCVFLKGHHSDLAKVLSYSKVFVLASDYEGMPNGLIEAMACGCACISTNCDFGPSELITHMENGILVETGNANAIYRAMLSIISDDNFGSRLSTNAKKINKTHSLESVAVKYREYIEAVVDKND